MGKTFYFFINEITTSEYMSHCHGNKTALRMSLFNIFGGKVRLCSNKKLAYSSDMRCFVVSFSNTVL